MSTTVYHLHITTLHLLHHLGWTIPVLSIALDMVDAWTMVHVNVIVSGMVTIVIFPSVLTTAPLMESVIWTL